jgi:hypothetical protein
MPPPPPDNQLYPFYCCWVVWVFPRLEGELAIICLYLEEFLKVKEDGDGKELDMDVTFDQLEALKARIEKALEIRFKDGYQIAFPVRYSGSIATFPILDEETFKAALLSGRRIGSRQINLYI